MPSSRPLILPLATFACRGLLHDYSIYPYWDDQYTLLSGFGIFTTVEGTAPNRIFDIECRNQYFPGTGTAHYELRLYEGQTRFDVVYGQLDNGNSSATAGVQKNDTAFDQYFCNGSGEASTGAQSYILQACSPSPTPTASPTATATATATPTATATATATATPTPTPTPRLRQHRGLVRLRRPGRSLAIVISN